MQSKTAGRRGNTEKRGEMELRLIMADPAGNRTAIVRTPVPAALRAKAAAEIMKIQELRAEQVGFETAPLMGGAGRLEMMGGEFCGNAARSFGFLCFSESGKSAEAGKPGIESIPVSGSADGDILIEISGSTGLLRVSCDPESGTAFSEMPMPQRMELSEEGYPLIISEGIAHMILKDTDPDSSLIHQMIGRYGSRFDAFGLQFLKGDLLIPVVYVEASGSLVYESSCGSGSLAAAWYLEKTAEETRRAETYKKGSEPFVRAGRISDADDSASESYGSRGPGGADTCHVADADDSASGSYRFREPGGEIVVYMGRDEKGVMHGTMGGRIRMEKEILLNIPLEA